MKIQQLLFKILRKQNVTDGRMDVKTIYPPQTKFEGGIKTKFAVWGGGGGGGGGGGV